LAMQENREYRLSWNRFEFIVIGSGTVFRCKYMGIIGLKTVRI
jgi:hypothetical protein